MLADIFAFIQSIAAAGAVNGLAQVVLKLTVPGVPDLYQGTDYWDLSLVDPDNRRPIDFELRRKSLSSLDAAEALAHWRDGRIKQAIVARLLGARRAAPELFARGDYRPVPVEGERAQHIVAFLRTHGDSRILVVVPRLPQELLRSHDALEFDPAAWQSTFLVLPDEADWHDVMEDRMLRPTKQKLAMRDLFGRCPVAIFSTKRS